MYCLLIALTLQWKVKNNEYDKINAVYLIAFLNFKMDGLGDNLRTDVRLINSQTGKQFSDKERFIFLQLPCFNKEAKDCETMFDRLIYVVKNMAVLERMPWEAKDQVFRRLAKIAEVRNLTKEERFRYDQSLKHYRDSINVMQGAIEEGMAKGMEEGMAKGMEEGRAEGRADMVRNLKAFGMPIKDIMKVSGLTEEEVINT